MKDKGQLRYLRTPGRVDAGGMFVEALTRHLTRRISSSLAEAKMSSEHIHHELVLIALERAPGSVFEAFGQAFYSSIMGTKYIPLGGMHDGGADGFVDNDGLFESESKRDFVQMSVEDDFRSKIRKTVKRLREFGRSPTALKYLTPKTVPHIDREEEALSVELDVAVRIRDRQFLIAHINETQGTRAAFESYLRPQLAFLQSIGRAPVLTASEHVKSPDVFVFLRQEVERRHGEATLLDAVIDALVLWALEGTDPDKNLFRSRTEIRSHILATVPSAEQLVTVERLGDRLEEMAAKDYEGGRAIRWHKPNDEFCLPYETRLSVEEDNRRDTALQIAVKDGFAARITEAFGDQLDATGIAVAAGICMTSVHRTFEREGLVFAHFLDRSDHATRVTVADSVNEILDESHHPPSTRAVTAEAVLAALRGAFYSSTEEERLYLSALSRTYALLFTMNTEPRLIEFFQEMSGNFHLYVGSDIIVRALSERYLPQQDQMTRNTLQMAAQAGATLVLAEPVLNEVLYHIRSSDFEFQNKFAKSQQYLTREIVSHSDKILVRAYFYAKLDTEQRGSGPTSWEKYVNQFCDYGLLHKPAGRESIRQYLQAQFGLVFESTVDLVALVDAKELRELSAAFAGVKKRAVLADNDALMTLSVYARRRKNKESAHASEFGHRTWWLTGESAILAQARDTIKKNDGQRFMMRPEFLLNFLGLAPSAAQVRETFRSIFPSLLGIRLAGRMSEEPFSELMKKVDEAMELEPGGRQAKIASLSNGLKGSFSKRYHSNFA